MKKKIAISILILISIIGLIYKKNLNKEKDNDKEMIAIFLEEEKGTEKYQRSSLKKWPVEDEYVINMRKSYCKNGGSLNWNQETKKISVTSKGTDKCFVYFDILDERFSSYIINIYNSVLNVGDGELNYHNNRIDVNKDGIIDDAGDYSYRYSGNNPNNFVCFGTNDCSKDENNEHLYRILGVFPIQLDNGTTEYRVKLIKSEYITDEELGMEKYGTANMNFQMESIVPRVKKTTNVHIFRWINENGNNNWLNSELKDKLNSEENGFLRNFNQSWLDMIADTKWFIGGTTQSLFDTVVPKVAYENELGINRVKEGDENKCIEDKEEFVTCTSELLETNAKIGLMHLSDYGFTVKRENWINTTHNNSSQTQKMNNWIYNGFYEFFITRSYLSSNIVFQIDAWGYIGAWTEVGQTVRPTFYLKNSVNYLSGSGTESDPYYIK